MEKDTLVQILLGTVILGGLGYLVKEVSEVKVTFKSDVGEVKTAVGTIDTKVTSAIQRVDRIAEALPDVKIRVATEEVNKPIQTMLITTKPFEQIDGQWAVLVHLIDSENAKKTTYVVKLSDEKDRKATYSILGLGWNLEPHVSSARELMGLSATIKQPASLPSFIDIGTTLAFHSTTGNTLKENLYWLGPSTEAVLENPPENWIDFVETLKKKPEGFKPTK